MAIDGNIYNNGVKGLLSYYEISALPKDYEMYKPMFWEATWTREGKPAGKKYASFDNRQKPPKKMSKLQEEMRMMQILGRATYGMKRYGTCPVKELYTMPKQGWFSKLLFWLNPKRLWNIWKLKQDFKKLWKGTRERRNEATKEINAYKKERVKQGQPLRYDVDKSEWRPMAGCGIS